MTHAASSARRFGGIPEDYVEIHDFMDSSKAVFPDNRHRALTHNSWFIFVVERVFGHEISLTCTRCDPGDLDCRHCDGTGLRGTAKVRYVCEQHVLEDFGGKYIPTPGDYLEGMEFQDWMDNGVKGVPTSHRRLKRRPRLLD